MKHWNRNALSCRRVDALASIACGRPHTTDRRPPARLRSARRLAGRLLRAGPLARRALPCGGRRARRCFGPSYAAKIGVGHSSRGIVGPRRFLVVPCSGALRALRRGTQRYDPNEFGPHSPRPCVRPCLAGVGAAAASVAAGPKYIVGSPQNG